MSISDTLLNRLTNKDLARDAAPVGGKWVTANDAGKTFTVTNPATGEVVAELPDLGVADARTAIDAAHAIQKDWAKRPARRAPRRYASSMISWLRTPTISPRS